MTLPNERIQAIKNTRQFLYDLLDPKKTPRVPKAVRTEARWCLKHYPWDMYLNEVLGDEHKKEEALVNFVSKYSKRKSKK